MADQRAFNDVFGRDKAEEVFHMAGQDRGQPEGHNRRRQVEVRFDGRDSLPGNTRSRSKFTLRQSQLRANRSEAVRELN